MVTKHLSGRTGLASRLLPPGGRSDDFKDLIHSWVRTLPLLEGGGQCLCPTPQSKDSKPLGVHRAAILTAEPI